MLDKVYDFMQHQSKSLVLLFIILMIATFFAIALWNPNTIEISYQGVEVKLLH